MSVALVTAAPARDLDDDLRNALPLAGRDLLHEPADPQSVGTFHLAVVGVDLAADDLQQRRFAGAVAAQQPDPLAAADLQIDFIQERRPAPGEGDLPQTHQ